MTHQEGLAMVKVVDWYWVIFLHDVDSFLLGVSLVADDQILTSLGTKGNCIWSFNLYLLVVSPQTDFGDFLAILVEEGEFVPDGNNSWFHDYGSFPNDSSTSDSLGLEFYDEHT